MEGHGEVVWSGERVKRGRGRKETRWEDSDLEGDARVSGRVK